MQVCTEIVSFSLYKNTNIADFCLLWENSTDRQGIDAIALYGQFLYIISQLLFCFMFHRMKTFFLVCLLAMASIMISEVTYWFLW